MVYDAFGFYCGCEYIHIYKYIVFVFGIRKQTTRQSTNSGRVYIFYEKRLSDF